MARFTFAGMWLVMVAPGALGEQADQALAFEVASVKPAPPPKEGEPRGTVGCSGGPGSKDPGRYTCSKASVSLMAIYAYGIKPYQVRPPVVTDTMQFNVEAKVPSGASGEQIRGMLRSLLDQRFKLAFHREHAETDGYALLVAKNGPRIKPSVPAEGNLPTTPVRDPDGFVYIPPRNRLAVSQANGLIRWAGNNVAMDCSPDC